MFIVQYFISSLFICILICDNFSFGQESYDADKDDTADSDDVKFSLGNRVLHGRKVVPGKYPFQVSLQEVRPGGTVKFCGGAIISRRWVVTAAHCYDDVPKDFKNDYRINAGVVDAWDRGTTSQFIPIKRIILHPKYNPTNFKNDIALLQLKIPLQYNKYVRRILLPSKNYQIADSGEILGWGATDNLERRSSNKLLAATIPVSNRADCEKTFGSLDSSQICLGLDSIYNACAGDSGGAFIQKWKGKDVLVGVTSFGKQGCYEYDPIIYTNVGSHINFIRQTINQFNKHRAKSQKSNNTSTKHPYLAALVEKDDLERGFVKVCTGTILNDQWILTGAHCFDNIGSTEDDALFIRVGTLDLDDNSAGELYNIKNVIVHPDYRPDDDNLENDIALVKLKSKLKFTNEIQSALYSNKIVGSNKGCILGWQSSKNNTSDNEIRTKFIEAYVNVLGSDECKQTFPNKKSSQICVMKTGNDCNDDSSAPLISKVDGKNIILGINSIPTEENCANNKPFLLTNIQFYASKIDEIIEKN